MQTIRHNRPIRTLIGKPVHLVLEDEDGEFEVRDAILWSDDMACPRISMSRIIDAAADRENQRVAKRPVF